MPIDLVLVGPDATEAVVAAQLGAEALKRGA